MFEIDFKVDGQVVKTVQFSDQDYKALEHVVVDPVAWFLPEIQNNTKGNNGFKGGPIMQKIVKCRKLLIQEGLPILRADPSINNADIPEDNDQLIDMIVGNTNYKNRQQRENENGND